MAAISFTAFMTSVAFTHGWRFCFIEIICGSGLVCSAAQE
jgi:hypothetical protein